MLGYGSTDNHTLRTTWVEIDDSWDAFATYSWGVFYKLNTAVPNTAERPFFGKIATTTSSHWFNSLVGATGSDNDSLKTYHRDSTTTTSVTVASNVADDTSDVHSLVFTWDGTTAKAYVDAGTATSVGLTRTIEDNAAGLVLGFNGAGLGTGGPAADYGHLTIWGEKVLTAADVTQFHAGVSLPEPGSIFFYAPLVSDRVDIVTNSAGTDSAGGIDFVENIIDAYFTEQTLADYLQIATNRLLSRVRDREFYTVKVPWRFWSIELMELGNISHSALPKAESLLEGIEDHGLMDPWRRSVGRLVEVKPDPINHTLDLKFKAHEKMSAVYFSTDQLTSLSGTNQQGLARRDVGGTLTVDRSSSVLLEQEARQLIGLNLLPIASADGQAWMPVGAHKEKINHLGALYEEGTTNDVLYSVFPSSLTGWTSVATTGIITVQSGVFHAFPQSVTSKQIRIGGASSEETYIHPTTQISVLAAQLFRRMSFIHSGAPGALMNWLIQRDTDSWYWNDSTEAWQASKVWNDAESGMSANNVQQATRTVSNPIPVDNDEDWDIQIGVNDQTIGPDVYLVDLTRGPYIYSPIATAASAVTTNEDTVTRALDVSGRQLVPAARDTVSFKMLAVQDESWMADDDEFALYAWQYDDTENNYDVVKYRKPSGSNAQFAFEHYLSGSLDCRAFLETDIVAGTEYAIDCLWTSESSGELGLDARTYRIRVDKVNGTDAQASALHDDTEEYTKIWYGCAPSGDGSLRAMNYLHHLKIQPRVLADEEDP